MKYVIISVIALAAVFGLCFLTAGLIRRRIKRKPPMWAHILICTGISLAVIIIAAGIFISITYKADDDAIAVLSDTKGASVTRIDGGYMLDGERADTAIVFYPGARVETEAYLPLLKQIADGGIDCFILDMPMHIAILDINAADRIISSYGYDKWVTAGHSMGGISAAEYAAHHSDTVDAVILLGAYANSKLPDNIFLYSFYGTEDHVLEHDDYERAKGNFPAGYEEFIIEGGNHAQFGNYGEQVTDGKAAISREEQQKFTADKILSLLAAEKT